MEEGSTNESVPDLKDLEVKIGRKTPEGLLRWMREEGSSHRGELTLHTNESQDPERKSLDEKIRKLRHEMAHLRAVDVRILQQLLALHEGIETVKWLLEERGALTSRCSSLTSSQYSLGEGPDTSWRGSWSSLQDPHDKLDNISIGSYLDTLADDLDEYCPSSGGESLLCSTPLGTDNTIQTGTGGGGAGSGTGSPHRKPEGPKDEAPVWAAQSEVVRPSTTATQNSGQVQPNKNRLLDKALRQAGNLDSARACLSEKLGKPCKKVELDSCKLNGKTHLEYDAHWRWVQSQDDVTFL
ncbi:leucine rich adaptor protein 1 [Chanos chanos]|uniref:Leucine rich adaptor protein 1 n=1 Tax=Chanos chanos TaxID=29144 RepID=A0A6J2WTD0_CHACN|nr:leucine rich adaptor protein 1 [Chanos chanos]